ncbi:MAG: hypothetical protein IT289_00260 [Oligoflexia bacterium]|nr:hypothetical protein [Oligoflexia bacterium]
MKNIVILVALLGLNSMAHAGQIRIDPAFMYLYASETDSGTTATRTTMPLHLTAGYQFDGPIFVGALVATESITVNSGSSTSKDSYMSYGPTLGLEAENFFLHFSYMIASDLSRESGGSTTKYKNGSGFYSSLGYRFTLSPSLSFGPQITYANLKFTKRAPPTGAEVNADLTETWITPMLALSFRF